MAAELTLLYDFDNAIQQKIATKLKGELAGSRIEYVEHSPQVSALGPDSRIFVTIGEKALSRVEQLVEERLVIAVLVDERRRPEGERLRNRVHYLKVAQPLQRTLALIEATLQDTALLVPVGSRTDTARLQELRTTLDAAGMPYHLLQHGDEPLQDFLNRLFELDGVFVAIPDREIINRETIKTIILGNYYRGKPLIGYSQSMVKAGAVMAVYTSEDDLVAMVLDTIMALEAGQSLSREIVPASFTLSINYQVAKALDLHIEPEGEVKREVMRILAERYK